MAVNKKNILARYSIVVVLMALMGIAVVFKAAIIMFYEHDYWEEVASRLVRESVVIKPNRGNILSTDGQLMASSLPEYKIYLDYLVSEKNEKSRLEKQFKKDSIFKANLDSICLGLHEIFPDKSVAFFKNHLMEGFKKRRRSWQVYPGRVSFIQFQQAKKLPVFREDKYKGGFYEQALQRRKKPFGSLASRTIGDLFIDTNEVAKNGVEMAFDTLLKGVNGVARRQRVRNLNLDIVEQEPVDGCDIVTTIDVSMQDIAEKALLDKLKELNASVGVAILMEVATGEIKAMVNMQKAGNGNYYEMRNSAISDMLEPGSTFKTASIMVALEDGYITPHTTVDTGNGIMKMHGSFMKDHNWNRGGYGVIDVTRILEVSSNIGVSCLIDKYYQNQPQKFVDGLKRMSIDQPLHLQIPGEGKPNIRGPKERYFAKTTLPWMSIGYETQIPPLNILTFYNAIANNGCMVRPKLVKAAVKDGRVVREYPTEVINPKICSDKTLSEIRTILHSVVANGLAKPAGSKQFAVSGKTGTAQISKGSQGYKSGPMNYLVSFCGYFPSEAPKYSCIVSIQKPGYPASGGGMAGPVFSKIAERVYAKNLNLDIKHAIDSTSNVIPDVMKGDLSRAELVLSDLEVPITLQGDVNNAWGVASMDSVSVSLVVDEKTVSDDRVPNVVGMGARDAVFQLERRGLKVRVAGVGKVRSQSIPSGNKVVKGQIVLLTMR